MTRSSSFLRHAAIYGMGNVLVHAAGFVLLPLYVRCLSEAEYGTLDILNRLSEVVLLFLLVNGIRQAMLSFHNQAREEHERRAVIGNALIVTLGLLGGGGLLVCAFAPSLSQLLDLGSPACLCLAAAGVFLEAFALLMLTLAQARVESAFFTTVNLCLFLLRALLCVLFVSVLGWGIQGVLLANVLAPGGVGCYLLFRELRRGKLCVHLPQLRSMLWFALPFIPGGIGMFFLNSGDRIFLLQHVSRDEIGAYALGYKLALLVKLLTRRPLYQVWSARMYDAARLPDAPDYFGKVFTRILLAYAGVGLALCLLPVETVFIVGGSGYARAAAIIPPVVLAYFFLTAADLMDAGFYVRRRTIFKTPITLLSSAVTLCLYALLIPPLGIEGTALATLLGFAFNAVVTLFVSQRVFRVRYEWGRVTLLLIWAVVVWLLGRLLPVGLAWLPAKALLWLAWPVLLWLTVLADEEKAHVLSLLGRRAQPQAS